MQYNPSIIAARSNIDIADASVRLQRSGHFPTLDLVASYTSFTNNEFILRDDLQNPIANVDLTNDDQRIGLQLSVPMRFYIEQTAQ